MLLDERKIVVSCSVNQVLKGVPSQWFESIVVRDPDESVSAEQLKRRSTSCGDYLHSGHVLGIAGLIFDQ